MGSTIKSSQSKSSCHPIAGEPAIKKRKLAPNQSISLPQTRSITSAQAVLMERNPNRIKKNVSSNAMEVDTETMPTNLKKRTLAETDFAMDRGQTSPKRLKTFQCKDRESANAMDIDSDDLRMSSKRRSRSKCPTNRIRRSGLEFCIECGIG